MENTVLPPETNTESKKRFPVKIILLVIAVFALGYFSGGGKINISSGEIEIVKGEIPADSADYNLLWEALETLNSKYVDRPLDQQKLLYGAVSGLVEAAGDPYTSFLDPKQAEQFAGDLRGSFGGIGAEIGIKEDQLVVVAPLKQTPAEQAGLRAGDAILAINEESTVGMNVDTAVTKIRGNPGTQVKLTILHDGSQTPEDITITRALIEIKSVELETREVNGKKIAHIHLTRFGDDTKRLLEAVVDQITGSNYDGVILDLRNNPGGYLDVAVSTLANWTDNGTLVLKEKGHDGNAKEYNSRGIPRLKGMKTVVLVNGGSASASEIVAGALQDYTIGTIIGEKTFGKGSVQELIGLRDNTEVKITVAKWFTPKDRGIDGTGLEPDIKVELTEEDINNKRDPQLDKALEQFQ